MKYFVLKVCIYLNALLFLATPASADSYANTQHYSAQCSVQAEFYDPEIMANTMADPYKFSRLMAVILNPDTARIMMNCASNPEQWNIWMSKFTDPKKMMNTMVVFMNPGFYANWMAAFMSAGFYKPM